MFSDHENPPPLFTFQDSSLFDETKSPAVLPWINTKAANMYEGKDVDIIPRAPSMNIRKFRNIPGAIPRRRAGKKDRHSKICTAHGIRDRRMRLSLQIARKFFDLQDMLGYDKASKTIEWLFAKSKKAIKELIKDHPEYYYDDDDEDDDDDAKSDSFISECEVVSPNPSKREERESMKGGSKRIDLRSESRERARARARWRTREKMMIKILEGSGNYNMSCKSSNPSYDKYCFDHKLLGFSNGPIFEGVDLPGSSLNDQERVSLSGSIYGDVGTIEKFLGNSSMSCPDSEYQNQGASDYNVDPNCEFMGFFGSWDMLNNERGSSIPYAVANDQVSLGENPSSVYSATP